MKKWFAVLGLFVVCSSASGFMYSQLLSKQDIEFQHIDNGEGVALGSESKSEYPWGSYNQWQCFNATKVEFDCAEYDYGTLVPSIRVEDENEIFLFDTYVENHLDCEQTLKLWRDLTVGGSEVCIFAAHMPDVDLGLDRDKSQSLWYINRLKGIGGYWDLYESSPEFIEN